MRFRLLTLLTCLLFVLAFTQARAQDWSFAASETYKATTVPTGGIKTSPYSSSDNSKTLKRKPRISSSNAGHHKPIVLTPSQSKALVDYIDADYRVGRNDWRARYDVVPGGTELGDMTLSPMVSFSVKVDEQQITNNAGDDRFRFSSHGGIGIYSHWQLTDKLSATYKPIWRTSLMGDSEFRDNAFGNGQASILEHTVGMQMQLSDALRLRYSSEFDNVTGVEEGEHRLELEYLF